MANSLSQFIGQIRYQRDQELGQKLQGLIPLLDIDIKQRQAKEEYNTNMQNRATDYYNMASQQFGSDVADKFKTDNAGNKTPEAWDMAFKNLSTGQNSTREIQMARQNYSQLAMGLNLPEDKLAELQSVINGMTSESAIKQAVTEYSTRYSQDSAIELGKKASQLGGIEGKAVFDRVLQQTGDANQAYGEAAQYVAESKKSSGGGGEVSDKKLYAPYKAYIDADDRIVYYKDQNGAIRYATAYVDSSTGKLHFEGGEQRQIDKNKLIPLGTLTKDDKEGAEATIYTSTPKAPNTTPQKGTMSKGNGLSGYDAYKVK